MQNKVLDVSYHRSITGEGVRHLMPPRATENKCDNARLPANHKGDPKSAKCKVDSNSPKGDHNSPNYKGDSNSPKSDTITQSHPGGGESNVFESRAAEFRSPGGGCEKLSRLLLFDTGVFEKEVAKLVMGLSHLQGRKFFSCS